MLLLFERLSRKIIVMMRLHLCTLTEVTLSEYCELGGAVIHDKNIKLSGPGAQRPLWPYNDFFFTGHQGQSAGRREILTLLPRE